MTGVIETVVTKCSSILLSLATRAPLRAPPRPLATTSRSASPSPPTRRRLSRLAELDSRPADALHGDVLLAEVQGDPVAALSLEDDLLVAHPFRHTKPLAQLLTLRAQQLRTA